MRVYLRTQGGKYYMEGEIAGTRFNKSTGLRDLGEAEAYMLRYAELSRLKAVGIVVEQPVKPVEPTLNKILTAWSVAHRNTFSYGHLRNVSDHVSNHLQAIANLPVNELTPQQWASISDQFLATHSRSTRNGLARSLNLLFHWAHAQRLIGAIPFTATKLRQKKKARKIVHLDQYDQLVAICDRHRNPAIGGLVRFILGTGCRLTESLSARWEFFDARNRTYVPQGLEMDDGTKGGEAEHLALPDWLFDYLLSLPRESEFIFPDRNGRPYSVSLLKKALHAAALELGLPRLYAHLLRVSFASNLMAAGVDIRTIQETLRHGSSTTTEGYCEVPMSGRRMAKNVMDGAGVAMPPPRPPKGGKKAQD